jgi:hypothetical protein
MLALKVLSHLSHSTSTFLLLLLGTFVIGSSELFAQAGLEP